MEGREEEMNGSQKRTELSQQKKISQVAKQKARSVSAVSSIGWPVRYIVLDFIEMRVEMPGKMTVCVRVSRTCDYQAFVVFQRFSKQPGDDELGVDDEPDLFLDQTVSCNAAAHKPVRKVHLTE